MKLYKALGLAHSPPPTPAAIKEAFVSISLLSHPDRVKDLPATEQKAALQRFLKAKNAYEILKDKDKRREYDLRFNNLSPAAAAAASAQRGSADFSAWSDPYSRHHQHRSAQGRAFEEEDDDDTDEKPDVKSRFSNMFRNAFKSKARSNPYQHPDVDAYDQREATRATALIWTAMIAFTGISYFWYNYSTLDTETRLQRELAAQRSWEQRTTMPVLIAPKLRSSSAAVKRPEESHVEDSSPPKTELEKWGINPLFQLDPTIVNYMNKAKDREAQSAKLFAEEKGK